MDTDSTMLLVVLACLLFLSALFSSAETAFLSCNRIRLMNMRDENDDKKADAVLKLLENQSHLISTLLVGNNIVNIASSAIATKLAIDIYGSVGVGIATGIMTLLVLIFGEVIPKNLAAAHALEWTLTVAPFVRLVSLVLSPIVWFMTRLSDLVLKWTGGDAEDVTITEDELKILVNVGQEEGVLDEAESDMINSIFEFDDTVVKEIMVPRIDIVAVSGEDLLQDVIPMIVEEGHSRIPVYEESIDNIIGVLYVKDIFVHVNDMSQLKVKDILRPAYYIPETKKTDDLLTELRMQKVHMAIILDEYGGTAGLVTIEDLIEQIIGDIQDEYDQEEEEIVMIDETHLIADTRALVSDVEEAFDFELSEIEMEESDADTIGGLVFERLGGVPQVGQEVVVDRLKITVTEVNGRSVSKVKIELFPVAEELDEEGEQE